MPKDEWTNGGRQYHVDRSLDADHPIAFQIPENICSTCGTEVETVNHPDDVKASKRPKKVKLGPPVHQED